MKSNINNLTVLVVVNDEQYGGSTYHSLVDDGTGIGSGCSVLFVPMSYNFVRTVNHEFGHGFAKLADEYNYENGYNGAIIDVLQNQKKGGDMNVSLQSDVEKTPWAHLAADSRYAFEGLGCYEGALYQAEGMYRPTEFSIMEGDSFYFTAPSREMIYKRCMKIANGSQPYKYDYEEFVKFDHDRALEAFHMGQMVTRSATKTRFCKHLPSPVLITKERGKWQVTK